MNTLQISSMAPKRTSRGALLLLGSIVALLILVVLSFRLGPTSLSFSEIMRFFFNSAPEAAAQKILYVRLPRTLASLLAGAGLALSGYVLQSVLHNPLCSPNIIGVNAGAGLFVVVAASLFPLHAATKPIFAFWGALVSVFLVFTVSQKTNASKKMIILAGIAINSILGSITDVLTTLNTDLKMVRADFMVGSFNGVTLSAVAASIPYFSIALLLLFLFQYDMQLLVLGDDAAAALGMRVTKMRSVFLLCAALLAGVSVSLGGLVGFVGLVAPHIVKMLAGNNTPAALPLTALFGANLCLLCDILSRVLFSPYEIPVGIVLAVIGSPFFLFLIFRGKRGGQYV